MASDAGSRWFLISPIWLGVAVGFALAFAAHAAAFTSERRALFYRDLGEPYQSYVKRTKRLIPFLV